MHGNRTLPLFSQTKNLLTTMLFNENNFSGQIFPRWLHALPTLENSAM
jgi:hypothetical protein